MTGETSIKIHKTVCNLCPTRCGPDIHVDKERMVRVTGMPEHPLGHPCIKSQAIIDWVYHKD
jgi:anaerobic selenocysteine-containing dehydrogenase